MVNRGTSMDREEVKVVSRSAKKQLIGYIRENISKGYSIGTIKKALVYYGYDSNLVNNLAERYNKQVNIAKYSAVMLFLLLFGISSLLIQPAQTGLVTLDKEFNYADSINISVNESYSYDWVMNELR